MEDSEGSPAPLRTNGRITVAVSATPQNNLALALPASHSTRTPGSGSTSGGREDCWSEAATAVLIEAWGERYVELSRGNLKQKHWREVADIVNSSSRDNRAKTPKTDIQCKNRIDTVKKKYKIEKLRISEAGAGSSKWPFFKKLDLLIGNGGGAVKILPSHHKKKPPNLIPSGVPVGFRSAVHYHNNKLQQKQHPLRRREDSDSPYSDPESSPEYPDSLPPARKILKSETPVPEKKKGSAWGDSLRELTQAVQKFGEAYEEAETSKVRQVVEMEKQRMKFAKEMELQRMQLFMNTQVEMSQLKKHHEHGYGRRGNHHSNNNKNNSCSS